MRPGVENYRFVSVGRCRMSDSITTQLDAPYAQQPATRAAARRVLDRLGAADLIGILGLDDVPEPEPKPVCGICGQPLSVNVSRGGCRKTPDCRRVTRRRLRDLAGGAS